MGLPQKIQTSFSAAVKIILVAAIFYAIYFHLWHILFANIFLLFLLFVPFLMRKQYHIEIPKEFELIVAAFSIISFFLGSIRGLIIQTFFGLTVGLIGFTIMLILFANSKLKKNYAFIITASFSISLTFAVAAEMAKYYLKIYLGYSNIINDYPYVMTNLTLVAAGAMLSSMLGYAYMKGYRPAPLKIAVSHFKKKNPNYFIEKTQSPEEVSTLIKKGEHEKLEFKSTLRTNLFTSEQDKKMELSALKSLVAFMNSEGGTLLIGVDNEGNISGIEKDKFENTDRFNVHLTNLVKEKIGKEYLPYMSFQVVPFENKNIMKIECNKSGKPVFLKNDGKEHFFIRVNAASAEVTGSKLLEYIENKFRSS